MATILEQRIRESIAEYYDIYNKQLTTSVFSGAFMELSIPDGILKPTAIALPGEAVRFNGTVGFETPVAAAQLHESEVWVFGAEIDRNLLQKTDALSRGSVTKILTATAGKAIDNLDKRLTALLLTGASAGNLVDATDPFFSATGAIPGGSTIDNLVGTGVSGDAAEIREATHLARAKFLSMRGAGNQLMNNGWPRMGLMYSPLAVNDSPIHESVMNALYPDEAPDKQKIPEGTVVPMPNAYFADTMDDLYFFDLDTAEKAIVVGWQQRPILETNNPNSDSWIVNRRARFVASWANVPAFANSAAAIFANDA